MAHAAIEYVGFCVQEIAPSTGQVSCTAEDDRNLSREKAEAGLGPGPNQRLGKTPNSKSSPCLGSRMQLGTLSCGAQPGPLKMPSVFRAHPSPVFCQIGVTSAARCLYQYFTVYMPMIPTHHGLSLEGKTWAARCGT